MGMKKKNRGALYAEGEQVVSHRRQDVDEHGSAPEGVVLRVQDLCMYFG